MSIRCFQVSGNDYGLLSLKHKMMFKRLNFTLRKSFCGHLPHAFCPLNGGNTRICLNDIVLLWNLSICLCLLSWLQDNFSQNGQAYPLPKWCSVSKCSTNLLKLFFFKAPQVTHMKPSSTSMRCPLAISCSGSWTKWRVIENALLAGKLNLIFSEFYQLPRELTQLVNIETLVYYL